MLALTLWMALMGLPLALIAFGMLRTRRDERDDLISAACVVVGSSLFLGLVALTIYSG